MKRVLIVVALVILAAAAGVVRSHTRVSRHGIQFSSSPAGQSEPVTKEDITRKIELSVGAPFEIRGINGAVTIETSDTKVAEIHIVRTGQESSLRRRRIVVDGDASGVTIHSESGDGGFFDRLFGCNASEEVKLRLPREIALTVRGVNGPVSSGDVDGSVQISSVNGKVTIGQVRGLAETRGINGNISLVVGAGDQGSVNISGVNGNIRLALAADANADLEARGMTGSVRSDTPEIQVIRSDRNNHYSAHIGSGGNQITVHGVNGSVVLTRPNPLASE